MIRYVDDEGGYPVPSTLDSMTVWRKKGKLGEMVKQGYRDKDTGVCKYCGGINIYQEKGHWIKCICWLAQKARSAEKNQSLATAHDALNWNQFELWGDSETRMTLGNILDDAKGWSNKLDSWLILAGPVGTGKSHLLHTLDTYLKPWSLYLSVPDLKDMTFSYTSKNELDVLINKISKHPILLLDDIGAEYTSKYAVSTVRQIIMARYKLWEEYPTVIATNLTRGQLDNYDERLSDRLQDVGKVRDLSFTGIESRRRHGD